MTILTLEILQDIIGEFKADEITTIDLTGKTDLANAMIIATATSSRHATAMGEKLSRELKQAGYGNFKPQGTELGEWVIVDTGDFVVHFFQAEIRARYDLESLWQRLASGRSES